MRLLSALVSEPRELHEEKMETMAARQMIR
jgi:hypothetical protein